jgi:hypothetical protein
MARIKVKQLKGASDGSSAAAGSLGESMSASLTSASAITLTTAAWADVASIALTAGDWDVSGVVSHNGTLTGTLIAAGISSTSGNSATGLVAGDNYVTLPTVPTAAGDASLQIPAFRVNITSTTTYYLKAQASFTVGTAKAYGRISARRAR